MDSTASSYESEIAAETVHIVSPSPEPRSPPVPTQHVDESVSACVEQDSNQDYRPKSNLSSDDRMRVIDFAFVPTGSSSSQGARLSAESCRGLDGAWESIDADIPLDSNRQSDPSIDDVDYDAAKPVAPYNLSIPAMVIGAGLACKLSRGQACVQRSSPLQRINYETAGDTYRNDLTATAEDAQNTAEPNAGSNSALHNTWPSPNIEAVMSQSTTASLQDQFDGCSAFKHHPEVPSLPEKLSVESDTPTRRPLTSQHVTTPSSPLSHSQPKVSKSNAQPPANAHTASKDQSPTTRVLRSTRSALLKTLPSSSMLKAMESCECDAKSTNEGNKRPRQRVDNMTDHSQNSYDANDGYQRPQSAPLSPRFPSEETLISYVDDDSDADDEDERLYSNASEAVPRGREQSTRSWTSKQFSKMRAKRTSRSKTSQEYSSNGTDVEAQQPRAQSPLGEATAGTVSPPRRRWQQGDGVCHESRRHMKEDHEHLIIFAVKLFGEFLLKFGKTVLDGPDMGRGHSRLRGTGVRGYC